MWHGDIQGEPRFVEAGVTRNHRFFARLAPKSAKIDMFSAAQSAASLKIAPRRTTLTNCIYNNATHSQTVCVQLCGDNVAVNKLHKAQNITITLRGGPPMISIQHILFRIFRVRLEFNNKKVR